MVVWKEARGWRHQLRVISINSETMVLAQNGGMGMQPRGLMGGEKGELSGEGG